MADWMMDTFFVFSGLALVAFVAAWKAGTSTNSSTQAAIPLLMQEEDYYTPDWALDEEEWHEWRCPSGDSPEKAQKYYQYLHAHQQTTRAARRGAWTGCRSPGCGASWSPDRVIAALWSGRTGRRGGGSASIPSTASAATTTEAAETGDRSSSFSLTACVVAFAVALIVGQSIWGQKF